MQISVVGLGPGAGNDLTLQAKNALQSCSLIVGYTTYIELIKKDFSDKEFLSTGMKHEANRCQLAIEKALEGKRVAVVCSGDAGVYGMAGLLYEVSQEYPPIEIEIIPGITAACGGAAVLGAPLTNDFAVISLSDLLTPWEQIEKRLQFAAMGDFALCLYNPSSHNRPKHLQRACDILLAVKHKDTVCGWVKNIGRDGEESKIVSLEELRNEQVDMFTTVFVGNGHTKMIRNKMVTPRGYCIAKDKT